MECVEADVLLGEDDAAEAELILESLGTHAFADRVHIARDGEEVLDFVFARADHASRALMPPPRLVILDIKLPKLTGLDVLRQLKHDRVARLIPVVLLTSSNITRDVALGYALGANSYVQKPVDFGAFRRTVQMVGTYWLELNESIPRQSAIAERLP